MLLLTTCAVTMWMWCGAHELAKWGSVTNFIYIMICFCDFCRYCSLTFLSIIGRILERPINEWGSFSIMFPFSWVIFFRDLKEWNPHMLMSLLVYFLFFCFNRISGVIYFFFLIKKIISYCWDCLIFSIHLKIIS